MFGSVEHSSSMETKYRSQESKHNQCGKLNHCGQADIESGAKRAVAEAAAEAVAEAKAEVTAEAGWRAGVP